MSPAPPTHGSGLHANERRIACQSQVRTDALGRLFDSMLEAFPWRASPPPPNTPADHTTPVAVPAFVAPLTARPAVSLDLLLLLVGLLRLGLGILALASALASFLACTLAVDQLRLERVESLSSLSYHQTTETLTQKKNE